MFDWVKRLFKKKPEFIQVVEIEVKFTGRDKKGKFTKGNKLSPKLKHDEKGRFVREK